MDCSPPGSLCRWDFSGKNTGVGCHFLLQRIFPTQGLNLHLLHWKVDSLPLSYQGSPEIYYIEFMKISIFFWESTACNTQAVPQRLKEEQDTFLPQWTFHCNRSIFTSSWASRRNSFLHFPCSEVQFVAEFWPMGLEWAGWMSLLGLAHEILGDWRVSKCKELGSLCHQQEGCPLNIWLKFMWYLCLLCWSAEIWANLCCPNHTIIDEHLHRILQFAECFHISKDSGNRPGKQVIF